ncbi:MAG: PCYCGC motif-containing (lipo)protein [Candidatus Methylomirabilales bacterium]
MKNKHKGHRMRRWRHRRTVIAAGVVVGAVILGLGMAVVIGWGPQGERVRVAASGDRLHRVPVGQLPAFATSAPSWVQRAYLYAAGQPEVLRHTPCFCGCRDIGHRHNGDCYVQARHADETITFTSHAAT